MIAIFASLLVLAEISHGSILPCNPAIHCPPSAIECAECNPFLEECMNADITKQSPGMCTDTRRPTCIGPREKNCPCSQFDFNNVRALSQKELFARCQQVLVSNVDLREEENKGNNRRQYDYISACQEGHYTCFNGFCTTKKSTCRQECKDFCSLQKNKALPICQTGCSERAAIRYDKVRCAAAIGDCRGTALGVCPSGDFVEDGFSSTLNGTTDMEVPPLAVCCLGSTVTEERDALTVNFTIDRPQNLEESCCPSRAISINLTNSAEYISAYSGPSTPEVRRFFDVNSAIRENLPKDRTEITPEGVILKAVVNVTRLLLSVRYDAPESNAPCCCSLLCTCHGDPHCTAFDGTQASSYRETNTSLLLYKENDFEIYINRQGFLGFITELKFRLPEIPGSYFLQNIEESFTNSWREVDRLTGDLIRVFNGLNPGDRQALPDALTVNFASQPNTCLDSFAVQGPAHISRRSLQLPTPSQQPVPPPTRPATPRPTLYQQSGSRNTVLGGAYASSGGRGRGGRRLQEEIPNCVIGDIDFNQAIRFDVTITRPFSSKNAPESGGCCLGAEAALEEIQNSPGVRQGFCFGQPFSQEVRDHFEIEGKIFDRKLQEEGADERSLRSTETAEEILKSCDRLVELERELGNTDVFLMEQCRKDMMDLGEPYILARIADLEALLNECIDGEEIASDCSEFTADETSCLPGIRLEARRRPPGPADHFVFVRFFPAHKKFCNDIIDLDVQRITFDYFGETEYLDPERFDIRVSERIDGGPSECNFCGPQRRVADISVEVQFTVTRNITTSGPSADFPCGDTRECVCAP